MISLPHGKNFKKHPSDNKWKSGMIELCFATIQL